MAKSLVVILLVSYVCYVNAFIEGQFALRCRSCDRAPALKDCPAYVDCADNEMCYMDEIITLQLTIVYRGGCRARDICGNTNGRRDITEHSVDKREKSDILACSRCCDNEAFCNELLCGIVQGTDQTICNTCGDPNTQVATYPVTFPDDCASRSICQSNEMCYASTLTDGNDKLKHLSRCMNAQVCHSLMRYILPTSSDTVEQLQSPLVGKRSGSQTICAVCCGDTGCNEYACNAIKNRMINLHESESLDLQTLKEI